MVETVVTTAIETEREIKNKLRTRNKTLSTKELLPLKTSFPDYLGRVFFLFGGVRFIGRDVASLSMYSVPKIWFPNKKLLSSQGQVIFRHGLIKKTGNGYSGEQFKARKDRSFNADLFTANELETLEKVAIDFKETSTNDIIKLSHLEEAWKKNEKEKKVISYEYAFELNQI